MHTIERDYCALRKCITTDYPYDLCWEDEILWPIFKNVYNDIKEQHSKINDKNFSMDNKGLIKLNFMDHYVILLYRFSNSLWKAGFVEFAEALYYSLKMRAGMELFYKTEIGRFFIPTHAIGSIIDPHGTYGSYFRIFNGVHIGPFDILRKEREKWIHPSIGNNVTLLGGAKVYGSTIIGDNVVVSANTTVINEKIPSNCIVIGSSPKLLFKKLLTTG